MITSRGVKTLNLGANPINVRCGVKNMPPSKIYDRKIKTREGVGTVATVIQRGDMTFKRLAIDQSVIILIRRGKKHLSNGKKKYQATKNEIVAISKGQVFDVHNAPLDGEFQSSWIACSSELIEEIARNFKGLEEIEEAKTLNNLEPDFLEAFERAFNAIRDTKSLSHEIAKSRVSEVLLWLCQHGVRFPVTNRKRLTLEVRSLISEMPHKEWVAAEVANKFAMSEATFRRRLSDEGSSFSEIAMDVRMSLALTLLQATSLPIVDVAMTVGYESASRFAIRFKKRFGYSPSELRR